jgi:hypothetical protein
VGGVGFFFREYSGGGLDGVGMSIGIFFVYGYISEIDEDDEICEMLHMSRFTCCVGHSRFHVEGAMVVGACLCLVLLYFDITGSCTVCDKPIPTCTYGGIIDFCTSKAPLCQRDATQI